MKHVATADFWYHYHQLPAEVQRLADKNYRLLTSNPYHPSLHFKNLRGDLWSARVGLHHRALAGEEEGGYIRFWIGPHDAYDRLISTP